MRTTVYSLIFFFFLVLNSFGQEIYVVTGNNELYRLNMDNCSIEFVVQIERQAYDISFDPQGQLWGISSNGNLFLIDTLTGQTTLVHDFNGQSFNSLTIGADGTIYTCGDGGNLWSYSPSTGAAVFIGAIGFGATGDLTFYHGELYVAVTNDRIVKINLLHTNQSQVIIDDNIQGNILGIVSDVVSCNEINCYAITGGFSDIYLIDFENKDLQLLCQLNITVGGGASTSEFLNSSPLQIDTVTGHNANCKNENGAVFAQASGGTGILQYSINGSPFVPDTFFTDLMAGIYTLIIRDGRGCTDTSVITLTSSLSPVIDTVIAIPSQCHQDNGSLTVEASGGSGQLLYTLDSMAFQTSGNFENLPPDQYRIVVIDSAGCYVVDQAVIDALGGASIINAEVVNTSCGADNGKITIVTDSLSGTLYSLNGIDFQNQNEFSALNAQSFVVIIQDKYVCQDSLAVQIEPSCAPDIEVIESLPEQCGKNNGSITVKGSSGLDPYQYSLDGITFQPVNTFNQLGSGHYNIYIIDQGACTDSIAAEVAEIAGVIILDVITEPTACGEHTGTIMLDISGGTSPLSYTIDNHPIQSEPSFGQLGVGEHSILVSDAAGCLADSVVMITSTGCPIYIPNVFSPNGDGINDVFNLGSLENEDIKILKFYIFDRWGNNVFSGYNLDIHATDVWWDGRFKGNTMNPGVFAYYIEAQFEGGEINSFKGDITLVR